MIVASFKVDFRPEHAEALERHNAQADVAAVLGLVNAGALTHELEWTTWETSASA